MLRLLVLFLLLTLAYATDCDDKTNEECAAGCDTITGTIDANGHLTVRDAWGNGNPMTSINAYKFQGCTAIKSVTFPSTLTSIGSNAFKNSGLTSLTLNEGLETIGAYAFAMCSSLTGDITLPSTLKHVGSLVFGGQYGQGQASDYGDWSGTLIVTKLPTAANEFTSTLITTTGATVYQSIEDQNTNGRINYGRNYKIKACPLAYSDILTDDDLSDQSLCKQGCTDSNYAEYDATMVIHDNAACVTLDVQMTCVELFDKYTDGGCCTSHA